MYKLEYYLPNSKMFLTKTFLSQKTMAQYIRRNCLTNYKRYKNGQPFVNVGTEVITIAHAVKILNELRKPLSHD